MADDIKTATSPENAMAQFLVQQILKMAEAEANDPRCVLCGFQLHSHGKYSQICPVLVHGMLHQFRKAETQ